MFKYCGSTCGNMHANRIIMLNAHNFNWAKYTAISMNLKEIQGKLVQNNSHVFIFFKV